MSNMRRGNQRHLSSITIRVSGSMPALDKFGDELDFMSGVEVMPGVATQDKGEYVLQTSAARRPNIIKPAQKHGLEVVA